MTDLDRLDAPEHDGWHAADCATCIALDPLLVALNDIEHVDTAERDLIVRLAGGALDSLVAENKAVREAAQTVVDKAETDDDFDGQYIEYLVPADAIEALRAALHHKDGAS